MQPVFPGQNGRHERAHRTLKEQTASPSAQDLAAQQAFIPIFREHGLPQAIRSDNGAPFASHGLGGLTQLSVWWVRQGIRLERIEPASPHKESLSLWPWLRLHPKESLPAFGETREAGRRLHPQSTDEPGAQVALLQSPILPAADQN